MKTPATILMLLFNVHRVSGTCAEGDEYVYSGTQIESQRCSDEKYFYYTSKYENDTDCLDSRSSEVGYCWFDNSIESHCLETEECVWLEDNIVNGACYCAESYDCPACEGMTPAPTIYSHFECPEYCKVFYVGCVGLYCNCFGNCSHPDYYGCSTPIAPGCHTYYSESPTESPIPPPDKTVYWGCKMCCFAESLIKSTVSSIAGVLGLDDKKVKIVSWNQVTTGRRRPQEDDQQWEIMYEIGLEESDSTDEMMNNLQSPIVLTSIATQISADLNIELEDIETTSIGEDDPSEAASSSDSTGTIVGIMIGVFVVLVLGVILFYKYYWHNKGKFTIDKEKMSADGLSPVCGDDYDRYDL